MFSPNPFSSMEFLLNKSKTNLQFSLVMTATAIENVKLLTEWRTVISAMAQLHNGTTHCNNIIYVYFVQFWFTKSKLKVVDDWNHRWNAETEDIYPFNRKKTRKSRLYVGQQSYFWERQLKVSIQYTTLLWFRLLFRRFSFIDLYYYLNKRNTSIWYCCFFYSNGIFGISIQSEFMYFSFNLTDSKLKKLKNLKNGEKKTYSSIALWRH